MEIPLLTLRGIGKSFAGVRALDDVSLAIGAGEIHCLAGENGSGKSTLIKIVSGVHRPDAGTIAIDGAPVPHLTPIGAIERGIQVIYQDFSLFPNLTVAENLALPSELQEHRHIVRWGRVRAIARDAIARLGVTVDLDAEVGSLPVSGRQLVAIARALLSQTRLLIMDEPTTALTRHEVERLFGVVRDIRARGISVLFVSHKMREMLEISDRLTVLRNGRVVAEGAMGDFDEGAITRAMTGQEIAGTYRAAPVAGAGVPRLEVRDLQVPGAVESTNLRLMQGEIVGLAGLLGSGRTELALALFGMRPDHTGKILLDGRAVGVRSVQEAVRLGIAYVPEDRLTEGMFGAQTINRNLLAAALPDFARAGFLDASAARRRAEAMIRELGIATPTGERPVIQLSGGNQQRVVIGRWLMRHAKVLILNGPTVGVDVGSKSGIHRILADLAATRGLAILMISDDLPELAQHCDRVLLMHRGRIVDTLPTPDDATLAERLRMLT